LLLAWAALEDADGRRLLDQRSHHRPDLADLPAIALVLFGTVVPALHHRDASAGDGDDPPVDVTRRGAPQPHHERGDVVGVVAVELALGEGDLAHGTAHRHARAGTGGDGVDGDAIATQLTR